ncbi:MAG: hypothetical protein LWX02_12050 [Deltaproteobacteria bacterium]|nr:hypothetical protein [Deltaproteobacteria bacterium]MDL1987022.1 hypothetical protein [Deltaproteobacteria bacterium]
MKFSISKLFLTGVSACTLGIVLCMGATPVNADIYPGLNSVVCMADAWENVTLKNLPHDKINCSANDVEITTVIPLDEAGLRPGEPGYKPVECIQGQVFQLNADITVRTNANKRYDTTFYLPLTNQSPQYIQIDQRLDPPAPQYPNYCSMMLPIPDDEGPPDQVADVDIDSDGCGDISKAFSTDEYTLYNETIDMVCRASPDDPTRAEFTYCAAWSVADEIDCDENFPYPGQIPSQKSKCNCASFPFDVFIRPEPPDILKTLVGTDTRPEFGGTYTFDISFTNPSTASSLFIKTMTDEFDITSDGNWEVSVNLWGARNEVGSADGVYLTASSCEQPTNNGELLPSDTYSCQFTVHIVDSLLPGGTDPELYDDVIKVLLWDKNDDPVVNSTSCSCVGLPQDPGEHCSNLEHVEVTNLMPDIRVTKAAVPNNVLEPGGEVNFEVTVYNDHTIEPVQLTSLVDDPYGDLNGQSWSTCATGDWIPPSSSYSCNFNQLVEGNAADDPKWDTVTAIGEDNEGNEASAEASAMVTITDSPSDIELIKDADKDFVYEPGEWVVYNFTVTNKSTADTVFIDDLWDTIYDELTVADPKEGSWTTCVVDPEVELAPGAFYYCEYKVFVEGDTAITPEVINVATAEGYDDDGNDVKDEDDHTVIIKDVLPTAHLTKEVTKMIVSYKVVVTNDSIVEALELDSLVDDKFGDLNGVGGCSVPQTIAIGGSYTCEFDKEVTTSPHTNEVKGSVKDNELNYVSPQPSDTATVEF